MELCFDAFNREYQITLKGKIRHTTALGTDIYGNILRLDNMIEKLPEKKEKSTEQLGDIRTQLENAKVEVEKPFPHEEELKTKSERLEELNSLLDMGKKTRLSMTIEKTATKRNRSAPWTEMQDKPVRYGKPYLRVHKTVDFFTII